MTIKAIQEFAYQAAKALNPQSYADRAILQASAAAIVTVAAASLITGPVIGALRTIMTTAAGISSIYVIHRLTSPTQREPQSPIKTSPPSSLRLRQRHVQAPTFSSPNARNSFQIPPAVTNAAATLARDTLRAVATLPESLGPVSPPLQKAPEPATDPSIEERARNFSRATRHNNLGQAQELLNGVSAEQQYQFTQAALRHKCVDWTPLHFAAARGHTHIVDWFMTANPGSATIQDHGGRTPVHFAASRGHAHIVDRLVTANPGSATIQDHSGLTPLHIAAFRGHAHIVDRLVTANPGSATIQDHKGLTPLHIAAAQGHAHIADRLVIANPTSAGIQNDMGWPPICVAADYDRLDVVDRLLKVNLGSEYNESLTFLLRLAKLFNKPQIIRVFEKAGKKLLACELSAASLLKKKAAATTLQRLVKNDLFEPRVFGIVNQFLN